MLELDHTRGRFSSVRAADDCRRWHSTNLQHLLWESLETMSSRSSWLGSSDPATTDSFCRFQRCTKGGSEPVLMKIHNVSVWMSRWSHQQPKIGWRHQKIRVELLTRCWLQLRNGDVLKFLNCVLLQTLYNRIFLLSNNEISKYFPQKQIYVPHFPAIVHLQSYWIRKKSNEGNNVQHNLYDCCPSKKWCFHDLSSLILAAHRHISPIATAIPVHSPKKANSVSNFTKYVSNFTSIPHWGKILMLSFKTSHLNGVMVAYGLAKRSNSMAIEWSDASGELPSVYQEPYGVITMPKIRQTLNSPDWRITSQLAYILSATLFN